MPLGPSSYPCLYCLSTGDPLRLENDASTLNGLGFALWQLQGDQWRLLQCGSRFLSDAESRYAIIESELLAVVWAVRKCSLFLSGAAFELCTDHRPLVLILNSYPLDQIENPRLQRLVLKLHPYQLSATWREGTDNAFADALSHNPVSLPIPDEEFGEDPASYAPAVRACIREDTEGLIANLRHHELLTAARADDDYQILIHSIRHGFPAVRRDANPAIIPYLTFYQHLSVDNGLVLKGQRIVVPHSLRARVLQDLHASHQGLTRTLRRARQVVYWPNMTNDLSCLIKQCEPCRLHAASQPKEPLRITDDRCPTLPFESTSADLFSCQGWEYLVYVDRRGVVIITTHSSPPPKRPVILLCKSPINEYDLFPKKTAEQVMQQLYTCCPVMTHECQLRASKGWQTNTSMPVWHN